LNIAFNPANAAAAVDTTVTNESVPPSTAPSAESNAREVSENKPAENSAPFEDPASSSAKEEPMETEEPLETDKLQSPAVLTRTTSSPFLNLKAPASPAAGGDSSKKLFFGKPLGTQSKEGTSSAPSIFQLPSSSSTSTLAPSSTPSFGSAPLSSAPLTLFGRPLSQPPAASPLTGSIFGVKTDEKADQPKGFGAIFGSSVPKGTFGTTAASMGFNPFAVFSQKPPSVEASGAAPEAVDDAAEEPTAEAEVEDTPVEETVGSPIKAPPAVAPKTPAAPIESSTTNSGSKPKPVVLSVSTFENILCQYFIDSNKLMTCT
jgi:hypothetical protein